MRWQKNRGSAAFKGLRQPKQNGNGTTITMLPAKTKSKQKYTGTGQAAAGGLTTISKGGDFASLRIRANPETNMEHHVEMNRHEWQEKI